MSRSSRPRGGAKTEPAVRKQPADVFVARPFEGLASEREWVALRELVPAATAPLTLAADLIDKYGERPVTVSTVLPMAWPAIAKPDGRIFVGMQRHTRSGDVSRDVAASLLAALEAEPGSSIGASALPGPGPRLQDILAGPGLEVSVWSGFDYWLDEAAPDGEVKASLDRANESVFPTVRMPEVQAAYWCRFPGKAHVRWVLGEAEDEALAALARLSAAGELRLTEQTKFAGMFRAHGLLVPVWDLPVEAEAAEWDEPVIAFEARYRQALGGLELDSAQRRARQGLVGRQLTLRG